MGEYICGRNTVLEAVKSSSNIIAVYTSKPQEIKNKEIRVIYKNNADLSKLVSERHQGFVAEIKPFNYHPFSCVEADKPKVVLILDHIEDPHNFGAIIRTANGLGIKHIIIPKNRSVMVTTTVAKVASGALSDVKIIHVPSLIDIVTKLKKNNFWIYASSLKEAQSIEEVSFNYPLAMVVGNEAKGVSNTILKHSDQNVFIPMFGSVQSLNVSVATGILLFTVK